MPLKSYPLFMLRFKKSLRFLGLILLIILASFGVGMGAGVPISANHKREDANKIKTELVEIHMEKTKACREEERE